MSYTKGEWKIEGQDIFSYYEDGDRSYICTWSGTKKDAQLISAAPDLLLACKEAFGVLNEPGIMDIDKWMYWQKETLNQLQQAINKAEGKQ